MYFCIPKIINIMSASKILVPIGFSSESIIALNQACNLIILATQLELNILN